MAEINNQANVTYSYAGARSPAGSDSNITTTNVVAATSLSITKTPLGDTYIPNNNHAFIIRITNTGITPINDVVLQDNLGEITDGENAISLMSYITGSGRYSLNGSDWQEVEPSNLDPITISIGSLQSGDVYEFAYLTNILSSSDTESITNTATVSGTADGEPVTASASSTIQEGQFASVEIQKFGSDTNIVVGDDFTYTLILSNSGNIPATDIVVTDNLPDNFTVESITLTNIDGQTTTLLESDYTIQDGTLTIPSTTSALSLTLPANTGERIIFSILGRFTSV